MKPPRLEREIEGWLESHPDILREKLLIIGRQLRTGSGVIDLLAMDEAGNLHVIEVKRECAVEGAVAQVVTYASWVANLTLDDIIAFYMAYSGRQLAVAFWKRFGHKLPARINERQILTIVAGSFAPKAATAVEYFRQHRLTFRLIQLTEYDTQGAAYISTSEWITRSPSTPNDGLADGALVSDAIGSATSTMLTELHLRTAELRSAIDALRRPAPLPLQEMDKPDWVHADTYCFAVLYLPRFIWSFVPSSLLWALYRRWIREEAALGVQRYQREDAHKALAEAVAAVGGWEKRQLSMKAADPLMAADEPLAKLVEWESPLRKVNAVGYRRMAAK
ncbi:endonuclease NucS domain-containing protein [Microbacterium sp. PA5]|uniref:endonuclease NucS domain-containing protein n=1 Tax=Microbacterium sp. PA5 TaxID=3416654 RepID=UPI003CF74CB1